MQLLTSLSIVVRADDYVSGGTGLRKEYTGYRTKAKPDYMTCDNGPARTHGSWSSPESSPVAIAENRGDN